MKKTLPYIRIVVNKLPRKLRATYVGFENNIYFINQE